MFSSTIHKFLLIVSAALILSACSGSTPPNTGSSLTDNPIDQNNNINTPNQQTDNSGVTTINWLPPTENTDSTTLTDLNGYKIYYGTSPTNMSDSITISNPGLSTYVIENLARGNVYYFTITAINSFNVESSRSNVVTKNIS